MVNRIPLAGCIIRDDMERVLLIHRATRELTQWELPGGKLKNAESIEAGAVREVHEELGIDVEIIRFVGSVAFSQGDNDYTYNWLSARITHGKPMPQEPIHDQCGYKDLKAMGIGRIGLSRNVMYLMHVIQNDEIEL